jgi:hypothetical protein
MARKIVGLVVIAWGIFLAARGVRHWREEPQLTLAGFGGAMASLTGHSQHDTAMSVDRPATPLGLALEGDC